MIECWDSAPGLSGSRVGAPERVISNISEVCMTHLITGLVATLAALHISKIKVSVSVKISCH